MTFLRQGLPARLSPFWVTVIGVIVLASVGIALLLPPIYSLAVLSFLGLSLLILVQWKVAFLLYVIALANLAEPEVQAYGLPSQLSADVIISTVFAFFATVRLLPRGKRLFDSPPLNWYLLFLSVGLISSLAGPVVPISLKMWGRYVSYWIFMNAVIVDFSDERSLTLLYRAMILSSLVPLALGIYEYLAQSGQIVSTVDIEGAYSRSQALTGGPWVLGAYLMIVAAMVLAWLGSSRPGLEGAPRHRLLLWLLVAGCTIGIAFTFYRTGWIALAGVLLAFAFWKRHVRVVAAIGIVITLLVLVEPRLVDRLAGLSLESGTGPTRLVLLRAGIDDFLASPIWGRGIGTFEHYYGYLDPQSHQRILGRSYHNGYIQIAADTGIVGLIALFVALILIGRQALRLRRSTSPWIRTIGCAFILTSLGVLIYSASSNLLMRPKSATYYWLLGGMVLAAHRLEARHRRLTAISHDET